MIILDSLDGIVYPSHVEYSMQVRYPDYDNQGIINNAHVSMFVETCCIDFFKKNSLTEAHFVKNLKEYNILFVNAISLKYHKEKNFYSILAPVCQVKWSKFDGDSGTVEVKVIDKNDLVIFTTVELVFIFNKQKNADFTKLIFPKDRGVFQYEIQARFSDYNQFGFVNLSSIATYLESTHLSFFGEGYLKTNWIRRPLPIIVKKINIEFFKNLGKHINVLMLLRVSDPEGQSSVKFCIDIVDKKNIEDILVRANLIVVHCNTDSFDWNSTYTVPIPIEVRKQIRDFHNGVY